VEQHGRIEHRDLRAAAGDREALGDLLDRVANGAAAGSRESLDLLVWAIDELQLAHPVIRSLVLNRADVDDVAQDTLVAVAETIERFRGESRFRTWLNQVARFKAIDHLRRKRDEHPLEDEALSDAHRISSMLASRGTLRAVLDTLPERYRQAVVLRDVEQLSYDELSSRLEVNLNTVKSWVARGRAMAAGRLSEG
jgi:RNA polymerase sigma-70 factor, ECF subfamily